MYRPIVYILSLLFIAGTSSGCFKEKAAASTITPAVIDTTPAKRVLKYLALGDSYTIGQNVTSVQRFPYLTMMGLRAAGLNVGEPQYIATTGWTTANLQAAITAANPADDFDIVTLLIGVNDQYQHKGTADYRVRFTDLLQRAVTFAANKKDHVFVLSIPDYGATPFVQGSNKAIVSMEIDWFNKINKQITIQAGIAYIDITPLTREAASDPSLLTDDNLHYSAKEHQKWADLLIPLIKNVIR